VIHSQFIFIEPEFETFAFTDDLVVKMRAVTAEFTAEGLCGLFQGSETKRKSVVDILQDGDNISVP